jgi:hypothetical protein
MHTHKNGAHTPTHRHVSWSSGEAATKNVKTKNGKIFFLQMFQHQHFPQENFMYRYFNITLMEVLMGLQKPQFLHGKTFYPGTSYPTNTALLILVCSLRSKFT